MSLEIFKQFDNSVIAGFSTKPDKSDKLRNKMVLDAKASNRWVIRPCLIHSKNICCITKDMLRDDPYIEIEELDGLVTDIPGVRLTSTHGDCIPLYAYDPIKKVIGLAHAGWKGTSLGIAFELINTMIDKYGSSASDINVFIGPGIDRCHFEFGIKEAEEYFFKSEWTREYSYPHENKDKLYLDLKGINQKYFELAGVSKIEVSGDCTYCMEDKYYSYRRSKDTDRMLAYIELK